jgi:aspartyl-tRNA(Asn)/glutamyl-tRNA(Gln) amidotransferase subunit A
MRLSPRRIPPSFDASLRTLEGFGCRIEEVSIPNLRYALGAELAILSAEASSYHREMMRVRADDVSSDIRKELDSGMVLLATDYLLGQRVRRIIAEEFRVAFLKVDVLATPTIPIPAPRIDQSKVHIGGQTLSALNLIWRNTYPANLTGSPALCVPCGFTEGGLPISLQLLGHNFNELTLLQVGHRFQLETDWHSRLPPVV